jgi:hypothetical protein
MKQLPTVDYAAHPALAHFSPAAAAADMRAASAIAEIDGALDELFAYDGDDWRARFFSEVVPRIAGLRQALDDGTFTSAFRTFVDGAFARATDDLLAKADFHFWKRQQPAPSTPEAVTNERLLRMRDDGYFNFDADPALARSVWDAIEYEREECRRRARSKPGRRTALSLHPSSRASLLIRSKLKASGALALASQYLGCEMDWHYCALEFSHDAQRWYRDCYADAGVATSKAVYMHLDADSEMLKGMLYLNDVGADNGPFHFVRGSTNWDRSFFSMALFKALDDQQATVFEMEEDRLDFKLGYYRPLFKTPEWRAQFLSLPAPLRGTTHFGDDLIDSGDVSNALLQQEVAFTGPAGTLLIFDGSRGIHRGGLVRHGERWVVQIAMKAVRQPRQNLVADAVEAMRYGAHLAKRKLRRRSLDTP